MASALLFTLFLMAGITDPGEEKFIEAATDSVESNFKVRAEDLFWSADRAIISTDRVSLLFQNRFDGFYGAQSEILIDGLPVNTEFFGVVYPQKLPIALGEVEGIYQKDGFGLYKGHSYSAGLFSVESSRVSEGLSFFGSAQISNEAGEPGPWVYDEERVSPNVERFGPGLDLASSYKSGNWYGKGVFRFHRHLNSDLSVQGRMKNMVGFPATGEFLNADAETSTGMIEGGYERDYLRIRGRVIQTNSDDFLFFQPLGREVPAEMEISQYTLAADGNINPQWGFSSYLQVQNKSLDYRRNFFEHNFDWSEETTAFHISANRSSRTSFLEFGSRLRMIDTSAPGIESENHGYTDLFLHTGNELTESLSFLTGHNVIFSWESSAIQSKAGFLIDLSDRWITELSVNYSETLPEFSNAQDYWMTQGASLYNDLEISFMIPSEIEKSRRFSIHVDQEFQLSQNVSVGVDLAHITHLAFHIPFQRVEYDLDFHAFPGGYTLFENQAGTRFDGALNVKHTPSSSFQHDIRVYFNRTLSGDSEYQSYWKTAPDFLMNYSALWQPFPDLELKSRIHYRSVSQWDEFEALDGEQFRSFNPQVPFAFGTFSSKTPTPLKIDLQVAKWFWEQRFRAVIMMKNILDKEDYSHPMATREGFTFVLRGEFRF